MARHGESKHFKRSVVTASLVIPRKKYKYYTKPLPGKHSSKDGVSILGFLRDVLKIAANAREARYLIKNGYVFVDGKKVIEEKYVVGFSDIVSVKDNYFLVWLSGKGKLISVKKDEKIDSKLIKVMSKHKGKKGMNILFTNDSRNIVYPKDDVQINDSVSLDLKSYSITGKIPFESGKNIIVFSGKNAGKKGVIKEINDGSVTVSGEEGDFVVSAKSCMVI
ncbi:MAG: RNA-binding S4 domain protein [Candidatus Parvarchaeum acidophilus ARMAN-5]|jgi:small subunit ribosomal protein S4e|uniref:Small ribosomal subunit protein eS4 n=1 Tax=Candidatus Parvarchaeum acidophilus ARMAN-5 TaxID=662762 RepID=D6GWY7_PARA5|nr:MAG: RNA-binding S4 domain protein [Candidatus Parvarchaeum acidophilus ARMAN-5]